METIRTVFEVQREHLSGQIGSRVWVWVAHGPGVKTIEAARAALTARHQPDTKFTRGWRIAKVTRSETTEVVE